MRCLLPFHVLVGMSMHALVAIADASNDSPAAIHLASCASHVSGGAVAGMSFAGIVAFIVGAPVAPSVAGGLLLGSASGGFMLDGCSRKQTSAPGQSKEKVFDTFLQGKLAEPVVERQCNSKDICMIKKYTNKWPKCRNLACFTDLSLENIRNACLANAKCSGFATLGGGGCYKTECENEGWNGYEIGQGEYWSKAKNTKAQPAKLGFAGRGATCNSQGMCMTKKYEKRWPNCENLQCFSNVKLQDAKATCLSHAACDGFAISSGISEHDLGNGCFKTSCGHDGTHGYEAGGDDYWAKAPTHGIVDESLMVAVSPSGHRQHCDRRGFCMEKKYEKMWPNCENLQCFTGMDLEDAQVTCIEEPRCHGFSMSEMAMDFGRGDGCFKTRCEHDSWNGYEKGMDGYWAKVSTHDRITERQVPSLDLAVMHSAGQGSTCDGAGSCMKKKYSQKWPNCKNLLCFERVTLGDATKQCLAHPACNGFSIQSSQLDPVHAAAALRSGCYKTACVQDGWNGFSFGADEYWTKVAQATTQLSQSQRACTDDGACMQKKYEGTWPNCVNLQCFSGVDLEDAKRTCLSHPGCHGFSMSEFAMEGGRGDGCYKGSCDHDAWNGYSTGSDGYWAKVQTKPARKLAVDSKPRCNHKGHCISKKYERKWPNCVNLRCFSGIDLEDAKQYCLAEDACHGFAITELAMDGGRGDGCYKTNCTKEDWNGWMFNQDGYWAKVSNLQEAKEDLAEKHEKMLDALIQERLAAAKKHGHRVL
jgi:hypothetical protein